MELPRLKKLYENLHSKGLEIIVVEIMGDAKGALKFIEENDLPYRFVEDDRRTPNKGAKDIYSVFAYPTSFIIDKEGYAVFYHFGFAPGDEVKLEKKLTQLLK